MVLKVANTSRRANTFSPPRDKIALVYVGSLDLISWPNLRGKATKKFIKTCGRLSEQLF